MNPFSEPAQRDEHSYSLSDPYAPKISLLIAKHYKVDENMFRDATLSLSCRPIDVHFSQSRSSMILVFSTFSHAQAFYNLCMHHPDDPAYLRLTVPHVIDADLEARASFERRDWLCPSCGQSNLGDPLSSSCFSCDAPRPLSPALVRRAKPSAVLRVRGLPPLATAEALTSFLRSFAPVCEAKVDGAKREASVTFQDIQASEHVLRSLSRVSPPPAFEGCALRAAYCQAGALDAGEPLEEERQGAGTARSRAASMDAGPPPQLNVFCAAPPGPRLLPLPFAEYCASYILDSRSSYFYEPTRNYFYDPNSKLYCCGAHPGKYYRHEPASDALFLEVPNDVPNAADSGAATIPKPDSAEKCPPAQKRAKLSISISAESAAAIKSKEGAIAKPKAESKVGGVGGGIKPPPAERPQAAEQEAGASLPPAQRQHAADIATWTSRQAEKAASSNQASSSSSSAAEQQKKDRGPACYLCRRKFPSEEILAKHIEQSTLHAENVAKEKASNPQYRDRIKERKEVYGEVLEDAPKFGASPSQPPQRQRQGIVVTEARDKLGTEQNLGTQMLLKMGWREGDSKESDHLQRLRKDFDRIDNLACKTKR